MPQHKKPTNDQPKLYIGDRKLLGRVRQYVDTRETSDALDPMSVTLRLQKMYLEYGRKKTNSLKNSVAKALQVILNELRDEEDNETPHSSSKRRRTQKNIRMTGVDNSSNSELSDSDFSIEDEEQRVGKYSMNDMMKEVYSKTNPESPALSSNTLHTNKNLAKSPGFLRCRSEPIIADMAPVSSDTERSVISRFADEHYSLPGSPLITSTNQKPNESPLVITIGDEETPNGKQERATPSHKSRKHNSNTSTKKSKKPKLGQTDYKEQTNPYRNKSAAAEIEAIYSTVNFSHIGGNDKTIEEIKQLLIHMRYPELYRQLGVTSPSGFLLHGPPGCGKTLMAYAIAGELELPFLKLASTELVSGVSGESEERLRKLFQKAMALSPCIVFIDEVDSITPKREQASKDMERRIVSQFLTCLDELNGNRDVRVLVIGATNRPDSLDAALRRAGRFDREICLGIPDTQARNKILKVLCKDVKLADDFDYNELAVNTPGYVGADLSSLVREAAVIAVDRLLSGIKDKKETTSETEPMDHSSSFYIDRLPSIVENTEVNSAKSDIENLNKVTPPQELTQRKENWWNELPNIPETDLQSLVINMSDFNSALRIVQPSSKREGFATVPDVTWEDVGALHSIREELQIAILAPVRYPEQFQRLGLNGTAGVLLTGPPGCGKTLLAKAIANESGINFISVKGPELINMYVGESEKAVRQVFQRARNSSPCVVFFDEIDALCPRRSLSSSDSGSSSRIVNQLLTELDGLESRKHVFVMAATNRPDIIDPAVLRPGRLDKTLYVGVPSQEDRIDILKTITKNGSKPPISDVSLDGIAADSRCEGYSGADLSALIREASMAAMREFIKTEASSEKDIVIYQHHFQKAFSLVKPSISEKDRVYYETMASRFTSKTSMDVESEKCESKSSNVQ